MPGGTVDASFAGHPLAYREMYDDFMEDLRSLGPVHEDAIGVGVFLKHELKFAEIRPKARSLQVAFVLPRLLEDPRISRAMRVSADRFWHVVKLTDVAQVDDDLREWLAEAYDAAGVPPSS